jgi:hypothetical protein
MPCRSRWSSIPTRTASGRRSSGARESGRTARTGTGRCRNVMAGQSNPPNEVQRASTKADGFFPPTTGIDLYWLPLGAGSHSVRLNGRIFEAVAARLERRDRCDLYHSALEVRVPEGRFVIEQSPVRPTDPAERGVVHPRMLPARPSEHLDRSRDRIHRGDHRTTAGRPDPPGPRRRYGRGRAGRVRAAPLRRDRRHCQAGTAAKGEGQGEAERAQL